MAECGAPPVGRVKVKPLGALHVDTSIQPLVTNEGFLGRFAIGLNVRLVVGTKVEVYEPDTSVGRSDEEDAVKGLCVSICNTAKAGRKKQGKRNKKKEEKEKEKRGEMKKKNEEESKKKKEKKGKETKGKKKQVGTRQRAKTAMSSVNDRVLTHLQHLPRSLSR
jgi:hypothetical protein